MIRDRQVSSREVVDAHLNRIADINPGVNAVTTTLAVAARDAATAVDRAVAAGAQLGPLAGVPFTVKENIDLAGSATTWGVSALLNKSPRLMRPRSPDCAKPAPSRWRGPICRTGRSAGTWRAVMRAAP